MKATVPSHTPPLEILRPVSGCSCCAAFDEHIRGHRRHIHLEQGPHVILVGCEPCGRFFVKTTDETRWAPASNDYAGKLLRHRGADCVIFRSLPVSEDAPPADAAPTALSA